MEKPGLVCWILRLYGFLNVSRVRDAWSSSCPINTLIHWLDGKEKGVGHTVDPRSERSRSVLMVLDYKTLLVKTNIIPSGIHLGINVALAINNYDLSTSEAR